MRRFAPPGLLWAERSFSDREQLWAEAARGSPDNEGAFASNATRRVLLPPIGAGTGLSFGSS